MRYLLGMALWTVLIQLPQPAGATSVIANPGLLHATLTGGSVKIGGLQVALATPSTLTGTVDAGGNILIPSTGINFAPIVQSVSGTNVTVHIQATHPSSGQLDPSNGQAALRLRFRIKVETPPGGALNVGDACFVGAVGQPVDINRLSTTGGKPYDPRAGTVTLLNANFSVPAALNCGPLTAAINGGLGLPSNAGSNSISLALTLDPPPQSGGSTISGGISDHEQGSGLPPDAPLSDPTASGGLGLGRGGPSDSNGLRSNGKLPDSATQQDSPSARISSTRAFYDDGTVLVYVGCDGALNSRCSGKLRLMLAGKKHSLVGVSSYRVDAGDVSAINVTVRLGRRALRSRKPVKLQALIKPANGGLAVRRQLHLVA